MGEVAGARDAGAEAARGTKRRRRRRPKRASAHAPVETATSGSAKTGDSSTKRGSSTKRSSKRADRRTGQPSRQKTNRKTVQKADQKKRPKRPRKRAKKTTRKSAVPTKREISAGGVVYRREGDHIEIVLASRRTRRGELAWGLAKGGIEDEESAEDAAVREVREETGLLAEIEASLGETRYFYVWESVRIRKTVHFFLMRHIGGDVDDRDDEMEEIRWFPLERALKRAAYRGERDVLARAADLLR